MPDPAERSSPSPRRVGWRLQGLFLAAAMSVALLALVGTMIGLPWLAALDRNLVPMPPIACGGVLLLALAVSLRWRGRTSRRQRAMILGASIGVAVLSVGFLLGHQARETLELEHWLARLWPGMGLTSVVTDLGLLGAALAVGLHGTREVPGWGRRQAAGLVALLPLGVGAIGLTSYLAGAPVLYGTGRVPLSLPSALCLLALGLYLVLEAGLDTWPLAVFSAAPESSRRGGGNPAPAARIQMLFAVAALLVGTGGIFYLRGQSREVRTRVDRELTTMARLKVQQAAAWYAERLGDARRMARDPWIQRASRQYLMAGSGALTPSELLDWEVRLHSDQFQSARLYDGRGRCLLAVPENAAAPGLDLDEAGLRQALAASGVTALDLHQHGKDGTIHLSFWVPVTGPGKGSPAPGGLLLEADPHAFLAPLLEGWSTGSTRVQTFLFRREGEQLAFIDDLLHPDRSRLLHGFSIARHPDLLAAQTRKEAQGLVSFRDDHWGKALGLVQPVPGSSWWLGAVVDEGGVYAPLRTRLWAGGLGILAIMLLLAMGTGLVLRTHDRQRMEERLFLTQRNAWLMQEAQDGILLLDGEGRIQEANAEAMRQAGLGLNELLGKRVTDLWSPGEGDPERPPDLGLAPYASTRFETRIRRSDGKDLPVEVSARCILHEGHPWVLSFLRDITERRVQEQALRRMTQLYWAMSQVNEAIAWCDAPQTLFDTICKVLVHSGGLRSTWVARAEPGSGQVEILATHGADVGETTGGEVIHLPEPDDCDVITQVIRENRACVIDTWPKPQDGISQNGGGPVSEFQAFAAFPIRQGGRTVAALAVRALETGFFGVEESALLEEATANMSFALDHLASEDQRKRAEVALAESEHLLREAQEAGRVGSYAWDILENRWKSSPYLDHILGIDATYPRDLDGWVGLVDPSHREAMAAYTAGIVARREPFERDYPIIRPSDGQVRWVHGQGILRFDAEGRAVALVGVIQDITERRRMEHALRKVTTAVDQSPLSIVITDVAGTIEYVNPAFSRVTGYAVEEAIGQNPRILRSPNTRPDHYRAMWETLARGEVWSGEFENQKKDGTLFLEEAIIAPVRDDQGLTTGYIAIKQDVTQARREADERRLLEAQLHQSQKLESLGSLAGGVAHDMNNVLGAILGLASALQSTADPFGPEARSLDTIINACMRGRGVVKSLLYFARKDLQEELLIDVNALIQEITQLLNRTTLQRINLTLDLADGLGLLRGDPGALSHALMNLCVNAVDAMPRGGHLRIRTQGYRDGSLAILVVDSGEGMSPEVLAKAREPFFTTKPMGKGTGLGLAMVHGTMQAHEGTFDLISQPGEGTEAILHFPASRVEAPQAGQTAADSQVGASTRAFRILLVDDDELIRESVTPMLEMLGHSVTCAAGGAKALLLLGGGLKVDLVILDMNMPGMTGADTLPRILSLCPGLPIILATGYSEQDVVPLVQGHPSVTSLRKPFSMKELQQAIQTLAAGAGGPDGPAKGMGSRPPSHMTGSSVQEQG